LPDEWSLDFFEEYRETTKDGMVSVKAMCPEGEAMSVYIRKKEMKNPPAKSLASTNQTAQPSTVWIVLQTDYAHHTDEEGRSHVASSTAYDDLEDANAAARELLLEACGIEDSDDEGGLELSEVNLGSTTEAYEAYAYLYQDDTDHIKMEVMKMNLHSSKKVGNKRPASNDAGARKKKARN
jgi:hypothetical protein